MKVIIERNSVCMGDDCMAPHRREYILDDNASYMDLFEYIKRDRYLPQIHGNNVVWVLANEEYSCIFTYFTKTDTMSRKIEETSLKNICKSSNSLVFKYYSSPERWKDSIYRMHKNDEEAVWRDGWKDEVEYCELVIGM